MSESDAKRALRLLEEIHEAVVDNTGTRQRPKQNGPYTCEHCGEQYDESWNLANHVQAEHRDRDDDCFVDGHDMRIGEDITNEILKTIDALPADKLSVRQISGFVECSAEGNVPRLWQAGALEREESGQGHVYWLSDAGREYLEELEDD